MGTGRSKLDMVQPGGGSGDENENYSQNALNTQAPDTIREALGTKGRKMSTEKAALGANPYYQADIADFSTNCQRAIVAVEMRKRGYDVVAQPSFKGDDMGSTQFVNPRTGRVYKKYFGAFKGAKTENVSGQKQIEKKMKGWGEGSRGALAFGWKGASYGHVVNVEYKNGKVRVIDGQVGKEYKLKNLLGETRSGSVTLTRLDNLRPSARMTKMVEQAGTRTNKKKAK